MKLLKKNSFAAVVFALTVVLSILISGHMKLEQEAQKVLDVFYEGERGDGLSIYSDLKDIVDETRTIISLSQKVMDPSTSELVELNDAVNDFQSAKTPQEYYQVYSRIVSTIDDASALFVLYCEDKTLMNQFDDAASVFASKMNTISYDPYNRYVRDYLEIMDRFPAGWIAKWTKVSEVSAFE